MLKILLLLLFIIIIIKSRQTTCKIINKNKLEGKNGLLRLSVKPLIHLIFYILYINHFYINLYKIRLI